MNIFLPYPSDLGLNASYLPDKLLVAQLKEGVQICANFAEIKKVGGDGVWKVTHRNHPSTVWATSCRVNAEFLLEMLMGCAQEYEKRWNKVSNYWGLIDQALNQLGNLPEKQFTGFKVVINDFWLTVLVNGGYITSEEKIILGDYTLDENLVGRAYRGYISVAKCHYACWLHSFVPKWWVTTVDGGKLYCNVSF